MPINLYPNLLCGSKLTGEKLSDTVTNCHKTNSTPITNLTPFLLSYSTLTLSASLLYALNECYVIDPMATDPVVYCELNRGADTVIIRLKTYIGNIVDWKHKIDWKQKSKLKTVN